LGKIGNVFCTKDIEAAIEKGRKYDPDASNQFYCFNSRLMGIQILHAEECHRPDYNEMPSVAYCLISKYQVDKVYIDGANPSFIKSLKLQIGEDPDYDKVIATYKAEGLGDNWCEYMKKILSTSTIMISSVDILHVYISFCS
jgi:hypothetical protein